MHQFGLQELWRQGLLLELLHRTGHLGAKKTAFLSPEVSRLSMADFCRILAFSEASTVYTAPMMILNRTPVSGISCVQPGGPTEVSANVP